MSTERRIYSKKALTATIAEIKIEDNIVKKASALVSMFDFGGKVLNTSASVLNNTWIIDFDARNYMNFFSRHISSLRHSSQKFISTANGNMNPVCDAPNLVVR